MNRQDQYRLDRLWADERIPSIKKILGQHLAERLFQVAPEKDDEERATDLITMRMGEVRIGCRIRHAEAYLYTYRDEFTIRSKRPNNATELSKIISGWGHYFFYGFSYLNDLAIVRWGVGDLSVFRLWYHQECLKGHEPGVEKSNHDGSSSFRSFRWDQIPDFEIARSAKKLCGWCGKEFDEDLLCLMHNGGDTFDCCARCVQDIEDSNGE